MANLQPPVADTGPIPEDNVPGHHPEHESDKPTRRPRLPTIDHRFPFRFDPPLSLAGLPFGVTARSAYVHVVGDTLAIRFGPWVLQTTTSNIESAEVTGPYHWWKVAGPPRLSFVDRGITFATTTATGVCMHFREPVGGVLPGLPLRHPGATVTVADTDDLAHILNR